MAAKFVADPTALRDVLVKHQNLGGTPSDPTLRCACGKAVIPYAQAAHQADTLLSSGVVQPREDALREALDKEANGPGWFWTRGEWAEWSNELAMLIPEGDESRYSNPEGSQESVILDCFRAYVAERIASDEATS